MLSPFLEEIFLTIFFRIFFVIFVIIFLLNYNILASLPLKDTRRDVRLINKQEIKHDVIPAGKLLCTEGITTTEYLQYALLKRWSIDKGIGRIKAQEMALKHNF